LVNVSKETVARLQKATGRHAQRFHDQRVRQVKPQALELDEQWSFVKRSNGTVALRTRLISTELHRETSTRFSIYQDTIQARHRTQADTCILVVNRRFSLNLMEVGCPE
jgi:hypothetical protein